MRMICSTIVLAAWALWFGGMIALFIFVQVLFQSDRSLAVQVGPKLFLAFERYQLVLAPIALVVTFLWRLLVPSRLIVALFGLLAVASVGVVVHASLITPRMEALRLAGQSASPRFRALHGQSMMIYVGQAAMLAGTGFIMPAAIVATRRKAPDTAPAKDSRA
ncbi:MAG: DUF4149 domain-containing protein [Tepidisphaeraceae bacterium]